jgi:hypothetical protein
MPIFGDKNTIVWINFVLLQKIYTNRYL